MLNLLFITNKLDIALAAERSGVNRIWVDLETLGKEERQKDFDTVKSNHSIEDIKLIHPFLTQAELLVRVNPLNPYSKEEIDKVIEYGADIIMLPYWKSFDEAYNFISYVNKRCKTILLIENKEAVENLEKVLTINEVDEFYIGLNDLHLSYGFDNMFEPFANGLLDEISLKLKEADFPFGIGGIGKFGLGLLPSPEELIAEHYRLGSSSVILSRTFCNVDKFAGVNEIEKELTININKLRSIEKWAINLGESGLKENHINVIKELA
jgi:2-keto-3-deoxy-L-rhamnonate aldolase RhmA